MTWQYAIASASFRGRARSEDRAAVYELADGLLVVLADGAGGIPGGGAAADAIVEAFGRLAAAGEAPTAAEGLCAILSRLDDESARAPMIGESTAIAIRVGPNGLVGASVGGSGAWWIGARGYEDLTEAQARKRRIGSGRATPVAFARGRTEGTLLVASDGLIGRADPEAMCRDARGIALEAAACALVARARTPSGDLLDDVVVVLVRGA